MFKKAKVDCDYLIVGLHEDPSVERKKPKPILSVEDRFLILSSIKFIDKIVIYKTEDGLLQTIRNENVDIIFLGDDYRNKIHNGIKLNLNTKFINRDHGWSTTKFKKLIKESK
jgi:glycerol-3-phosphate cytidylyltransferase